MLSYASLFTLALAAGHYTSASAIPRIQRSASPAAEPLTLHPLKSRDNARRSIDVSDFIPQQQLRMLYGDTSGRNRDSEAIMAEVKLEAQEDLPLLEIDNIEYMVDSVTCDDSNDNIILEFPSEGVHNAAVDAWNFVNDKAGQFLVVTNHEGCGKDLQRAPYLISKIQHDMETRTAILRAKIQAWEDVLDDFEINLGKASKLSAAGPEPISVSELRRRDNATAPYPTPTSNSTSPSGSSNSSSTSSGSFAAETTLAKTWSFEHDYNSTVFIDPSGRLNIGCNECSIAGAIDFMAAINVDKHGIHQLMFSADPSGMGATMDLAVEMTQDKAAPTAALSATKTLFSLPLEGIQIKDILSVGPSLDFVVGFDVDNVADATFSFGVQTNVSDSAGITIDLVDHDNSTIGNWNATSVTPIPFSVDGTSGSFSASIYANPALKVSLELLGFGYEASLNLMFPKVSIVAQADYDAEGMCGSYETTTGLQINSTAAFELGVHAGLSEGNSKWSQWMSSMADSMGGSYDDTLWSLSKVLAGECVPVDIPELAYNMTGSNSTKPAHPVLPSGSNSTLGGGAAGNGTDCSGDDSALIDICLSLHIGK